MENRAHALAAGLFVLLLGVALAATVVWFTGEQVPQTDYVLESNYPVTGLNVQSTVRFRGIGIGKVTNIRIDPKNAHLILIDISVNSDTPITKSTFAELKPQGITGLSYVMLDDAGTSRQPLIATAGETPRIPVHPSFFDKLSNSGGDLLTAANTLVVRLNQLLDEPNRQQIVHTLASIQRASDQIAATAARLGPALDAMPRLADQADSVLHGVNALTLSMNRLTTHTDKQLARTGKSLASLSQTSQALSQRLLDQSLPRLNTLLDELSRTSRNLDQLLTQIQEQPSSLVFGGQKIPPGPGEPGFNANRKGR
ncbi:MAG TPA: MlaD family protein [Burkholderiales bacterium]|nr:MlaD family protein [Burkholderiales bacterium]